MTASSFRGLNNVKPVPLGKMLYRGVRLGTLMSKTPPEALFASESQNRYNLEGVKTLYFGENILTAYSETVQEYAGLVIDHPTIESKTPVGHDIGEGSEPVVLFATKVWIGNVLDLTDPAIQSKIGVTEASLTGPWRWEVSMGRSSLTQQLGNAVYKGKRFEAIRFPSEKASDPARHTTHANWAVLVSRLKGDSFLEVSDVSGSLSGRLP
ncbi:MAG TPA: RES family NAD+ phosphorylase [Nitrososphaera sp.]|nr:RES family NAD+ phosphorylase [Nitrososphaera sp.]